MTQSLAEAFGHEAEYRTADGHATPEANGAHAAGKSRSRANAQHKGHDPATEGDYKKEAAISFGPIVLKIEKEYG